jgi:DNA repair protein RadC
LRLIVMIDSGMLSAASFCSMERPRERLARLGAAALSDAELLAVLLGTGRVGEDAVSLAARLLRSSGGLSKLACMGTAELAQLPGLGTARASRLRAAFEAGARALVPFHPGDEPISNSQMVFARFGRPLMASRVERFWVISVDAKNRVRAEREVARGGRTGCQVDPAEVFRFLISESASGAIFVHNHPSGDPAPSLQDLELTRRLAAAGSLLQIRVLDHVIVGGERYISLRDAGLWPSNPLNSTS